MIFGDISAHLLSEIPGNSGFLASKQFAILVLGLVLLYFALQKQITELKVKRCFNFAY